MDTKKNYIDLSKYNTKPTNAEADAPEEQPSYLSQLFKEPSDLDPLEKQKARDARFRSLKEKNTPPSGTFTK